MRKFLILVTGGMLLVAMPAHAQQSPTERLKPYVQPGLIRLDLEWKGWVYDRFNKSYLNEDEDGVAAPFTVSYGCTGFVVNSNGYVATAGHCVDPEEVENDILSAAVDWVLEGNYYNTTPTEDDAIQFAVDDYRVEGLEDRSADVTVFAQWSADISGIDIADGLQARLVDWVDIEHGDVALLRVDADDPMSALPLADVQDVDTGTRVVSIGYPGSVEEVSDADIDEPSFKEGTVSSVRTTSGGLYDVFEMSAELSGGMSGGPTVNVAGEVIGINSYSPAEETGAFNFAQSVATLEELMAAAGVENELGPITTNFRRGLDAYQAKDKDEAIAAFDRVLAQLPSHSLAQEFKNKAMALPDESTWILPLVVGLAVILLVTSGVVLFLRSRSRRSPVGDQPGRLNVTDPTQQGPSPVVEPPMDPQHPEEVGDTTKGSFCSNCGARNHVNARYCSECGTEMPQSVY